jgi:hypothetical protein
MSLRLNELRREIANLRNNNAGYLLQTEHSDVERSGYELRNNRLLQIKKELSAMLARPQEGTVWWEKFDGGLRP